MVLNKVIIIALLNYKIFIFFKLLICHYCFCYNKIKIGLKRTKWHQFNTKALTMINYTYLHHLRRNKQN